MENSDIVHGFFKAHYFHQSFIHLFFPDVFHFIYLFLKMWFLVFIQTEQSELDKKKKIGVACQSFQCLPWWFYKGVK